MPQGTELKRRIDRVKLDGGGRPAISHGDNVLSMIGLLCLGKNDFEAINAFAAESDEFFRLALGLDRVPSEPTSRQRLDTLAARADIDDMLEGLGTPGCGRVAVRQQQHA